MQNNSRRMYGNEAPDTRWAWMDAILRYGLLLALLIAPTQVAIKIGTINLSPVDPLIWGLFGLWLLRQVAGGRTARRQGPPATAILFVLAVALSLTRASGKADVVKDLIQAVEYFIVAAVLFLNGFTSPRDTRRAVGVTLGVAAVVTIVAAVQYLHPGIEPFFVRGTFGNRNILGGYLALTLPLGFALVVFGATGRRTRIALLALVILGCLVTLSGATLIALMLALPAVALRRGWRPALLTLAVLCALVIAVLPHLPRRNFGLLHESVAVFDAGYELAPRYSEWLAALAMWHEQPSLMGGPEWLSPENQDGIPINPLGWLTGVGAGNFQRHIGMYYGYLPEVNINVTEPDSHNTYLVLLSTVGLLGLLGFVGMLLQGAAAAGRDGDDDRTAWSRAVRAGVAGALLAYAVNAVWAGLLVRGIGIPLAFILVLPRLTGILSDRNGPRDRLPDRQPLSLP